MVVRSAIKFLQNSAVFLFFFCGAAVAFGSERQIVSRHIPSEVAALKPIGRLPVTNQMDLVICLPLRNVSALGQLLRQIADPASPNYRQYLTPAQFAERFGPAEKDYQAVIAFARAHGLRVMGTHPNRVLLDVRGAVADIEEAFHVKMQLYQHPNEARIFHAPDSNPSFDLATPVLDVSGLEDYLLPRPWFVPKPFDAGGEASPEAGSGSGTNGTFMGKDFRAAYAPDTTMTGLGQTIGLLEFDGYTASDIAYYENLAGLSNVTLTNVLLDGFNGQSTGDGGEVEVSLDIEMAVSMAPGLSKVIVYEAGPYGNWHDILNRMANDNLAAQLSCSWYIPGGGPDPVAEQIFQQMAAQGQSFFAASGDDGAYTGLIPFPSDSTNVTEVGGTTLTTSGPGGSWTSETVWNWGDGFGSGGGISTSYPIPRWQTNISMAANQGSTVMHNVPDVALTADNVYVRADGLDKKVGGTSCAAPLWAAFTALVNQQAVAGGRPTVGFINPALDAIGSGPAYTNCFHDITTGNDTNSATMEEFFAAPGYDLCTGWGAPAGQHLINALANPDALAIAPGAGFTAVGRSGGPFTVTAESFILSDNGADSLNWALANTSPWLTVLPSSGTLAAGGSSTTAAVSLNIMAYSQPIGIYNAVVTFSNLTSGTAQSIQFTLQVVSNVPPSIVTQPTNETILAGSTAGFNVAVAGTPPLFCQWQFNGTNLNGATNTSLTLTNVSAGEAGNYSVVVTNTLGATNSAAAVLAVMLAPPCSPDAPGLVSWWPAEGNASDLTGLNSGSLSNGAGFGPGEVGQAFALNGTNQYVAVPDSSSLHPASLSIEGWLNFQSLSGFQTFAAKAYGTTFGSWAVWYLNGQLWASTTVGGYSQFLTCSWTPLAGTWHHVAYTVNTSAGLQKLYLDGASVASGSFTGAINYDSHPMLVGAGIQSGVPTDFFNGSIDEVSFYNQALTSAQVSSIYAASFTGKCKLPPAILVQPQGLSAGLGGTATLAVTASGSPPFAYQWMFDGTAMSGATNAALTLTNLQSSQAGSYSVEVFNATGTALSSNATLSVSVMTPPVIIAQPQSQIALVGANATFSVAASGNAGCQWLWNGSDIAGATNLSLTITNLQITNSGSYSIILASLSGSVTSSNATLSVGNAPAIVSQPQSQEVAQGTKVSFTVAATGSAPLNYQWYLNAVPVTLGTSATLTFTNAQSVNNGTYGVVVSSPFGSILSANATLAVAVPPAIVTQPQSQSAVVGASVTFSVAASEPLLLPPVNSGTLQLWLKAAAGVVTNSSGQVSQWLDQSGNSNHAIQEKTNQQPLLVSAAGLGGMQTVRFNGIQDNVHGSYLYGAGDLGVANAMTSFAVYDAFSATNNDNVLWLIGVPGYSGGARCDDITGGDMAFSTWESVASTAFIVPTNTYRIWMDRVNTNLTTLEMFDVSSNSSTNFSASLAGTTAPGAGYYLGGLNASLANVGSGRNFGGDLVELLCYQGYLTESDRLAVANYLEQSYFKSGSSFGLSYQWQFNGTNLDKATNASLTLTNLQITNSGAYTVAVGNLNGVTTSSNALLTVNGSPVIRVQPRSLTVTTPAAATFSVSATGSPAPSFQWQVNNINVPGGNASSLVISNTVPADGGSYSVIISNNLGFVVSSKAVLAVNFLTETGQGQPLQLATTNLTLPSASQPGNTFIVTSVDPASQQGGPLQLAKGAITYSPPAAFVGMDYFNYVLTPAIGLPVTGTVTVVVGASYVLAATLSSGQAIMQFAGLPGTNYNIEASTDLKSWTVIGRVTAGPNGLFQYQDDIAKWGQQCYYRTSPQ